MLTPEQPVIAHTQIVSGKPTIVRCTGLFGASPDMTSAIQPQLRMFVEDEEGSTQELFGNFTVVVEGKPGAGAAYKEWQIQLVIFCETIKILNFIEFC